MYSLIISIILSIHPLPVDSLRQYYKTDSLFLKVADGYDVATVHPFKSGKIQPDWTSCRIDSTGKRRNKFIEYHFPITCEQSMETVYAGNGLARYYNTERKKLALPVTSELVFRFNNDRREYVAVRYVVCFTDSDTLKFGNGVVADVSPFTNQVLSLWKYCGGRAARELLWLIYPTYSPDYVNAQERYWRERNIMSVDREPSEMQDVLWNEVRHHLYQYKYFYHPNE